MQIVINLDIEAIVTQEIRNYVRENLVINNVSGGAVPADTGTTEQVTVLITSEEKKQPGITDKKEESTEEQDTVDYEYAPHPNKRRNKEQMALHDKELELKRRLTPEEKGQVKAQLELDEEAEEEAKKKAKSLIKATKLADELTAKIKEEEANKPEGVIEESRAAEEAEQEEEPTPKKEGIPWELPETVKSEIPEESEDKPDTLATQGDLFASSAPEETATEKEEEDAPSEAVTPTADNLDNVSSLFK